MTEEIIEENIKDLIPEDITGEMSEDILTLKKEIAKKYIEELKEKKDMWIWKLLIGEGKSLEKYLVSENKWDQIVDTIKWNLMDKFFWSVDKGSFVIGWVTYNSIFEYLKPVKEKLDNAKTEAELKILENEILTASTIVAPAVIASTGVSTNEILPESKEEITDRREAVLANLQAVLNQDEKDDIEYKRWGYSSIEAWLDCWGLIVYCANQAWLKVGGNSRELFQKFPSKKLEVDDNGAIVTDVSQFKEGDLLVFDSIDPAYHDTPKNRWRQREIIWSEGQNIHPHHFAFIKSFDRTRGIIHIVESNGSQGVTESECSIADRLDKNKKKEKISNLRAVHVNYDELEKLPEIDLANLEDLPNAKRAAA